MKIGGCYIEGGEMGSLVGGGEVRWRGEVSYKVIDARGGQEGREG